MAHNIVSISGGRRRHQKPTWRLHRADPSNLAADRMDGAEHGVIASRCVSKENGSTAFMVNGGLGREVKQQRDPASRKRACGRNKKERGRGKKYSSSLKELEETPRTDPRNQETRRQTEEERWRKDLPDETDRNRGV